jgi:pimeloyl-ACP methyl ester carboxylesterase
VAAVADRSYAGAEVSDAEWARVFAAFGPVVPDQETLARRIGHPELGPPGMDRVREVDLVDLLAGVETPTLVVTGSEDPVTPVAAAEEVVAALPPGRARLEVLRGAGHFPWLDRPRELRSVLTGFLDASA